MRGHGATIVAWAVLLGAALGSAYVYFAKPYLVATDTRLGPNPQAIKLTWYVRCGEERFDSADGQRYFPVIPEGGRGIGEPSGQTGEVAVLLGNRFDVVGFGYKTIYKNIFTGRITEKASGRIDVISWSIEIPYEVYDTSTGKKVESDVPVSWRSSEPGPNFMALVPEADGSGC